MFSAHLLAIEIKKNPQRHMNKLVYLELSIFELRKIVMHLSLGMII